jgi:uncharacterized protein (TIGR03435 family)
MMRPAIAGLLTVSALFAQATPSIEVASVRVHSPKNPDRSAPQISGDRLTIGGNVNQLVMYSYDLKAWQISGGPPWVTHSSTETDYYDISVKADGGEPLTQPRARQLLQSLLAERFRLSVHREKREAPVYALVRGRGPKLKESEAETPCRSAGKANAATVISSFTNCPIDALLRVLAGAADRPVLDQTGLTGHYDFKIEFARDPAAATADSDVPTLFTAVQDQLGLKLESQKGTVEVTVIDRVERPTEN